MPPAPASAAAASPAVTDTTGNKDQSALNPAFSSWGSGQTASLQAAQVASMYGSATPFPYPAQYDPKVRTDGRVRARVADTGESPGTRGGNGRYCISPWLPEKKLVLPCLSAMQAASAAAAAAAAGQGVSMVMPFPIHPAMYGHMQQMQVDMQAAQSGVGPLTSAQQAELARARQRGQRAAVAKQKLNKQKAALAAKRAKAEAEEAAKKKQESDKRKHERGGESDTEDNLASAREAVDSADVSALAAMTPEQQNEEIDKRLSGVECAKEQKRLKRLLRNRVSAQQARERKKGYLAQLEDKTKEQENEIAMLNQKVQVRPPSLSDPQPSAAPEASLFA